MQEDKQRPSVISAIARAKAQLDMRAKVINLVDARVDGIVKHSSAIMSLTRRKERLSEMAEQIAEHPDPLRAIDLLNKTENVYIQKTANLNVDLSLQAELSQHFTVEQLELMLLAMTKS